MRSQTVSSSAVKALRIDRATATAIERITKHLGRTFSSLAAEMLSEAAKMRRCPGIIFADGPAGRRARIEGAGVEVWEAVGAYLALANDERRLTKAYDFLTPRQIRAALGYFAAYPEEIRALVKINSSAEATIDLPFARRARR